MPFKQQLNNLRNRKELHSKNLENINFMIVNLLMRLKKNIYKNESFQHNMYTATTCIYELA